MTEITARLLLFMITAAQSGRGGRGGAFKNAREMGLELGLLIKEQALSLSQIPQNITYVFGLHK